MTGLFFVQFTNSAIPENVNCASKLAQILKGIKKAAPQRDTNSAIPENVNHAQKLPSKPLFTIKIGSQSLTSRFKLIFSVSSTIKAQVALDTSLQSAALTKFLAPIKFPLTFGLITDFFCLQPLSTPLSAISPAQM